MTRKSLIVILFALFVLVLTVELASAYHYGYRSYGSYPSGFVQPYTRPYVSHYSPYYGRYYHMNGYYGYPQYPSFRYYRYY